MYVIENFSNPDERGFIPITITETYPKEYLKHVEYSYKKCMQHNGWITIRNNELLKLGGMTRISQYIAKSLYKYKPDIKLYRMTLDVYLAYLSKLCEFDKNHEAYSRYMVNRTLYPNDLTIIHNKYDNEMYFICDVTEESVFNEIYTHADMEQFLDAMVDISTKYYELPVVLNWLNSGLLKPGTTLYNYINNKPISSFSKISALERGLRFKIVPVDIREGYSKLAQHVPDIVDDVDWCRFVDFFMNPNCTSLYLCKNECSPADDEFMIYIFLNANCQDYSTLFRCLNKIYDLVSTFTYSRKYEFLHDVFSSIPTDIDKLLNMAKSIK